MAIFRKGNSRFVIDLEPSGESRSCRSCVPPSDGYGFRLVIDLAPSTPDDFESDCRLAGGLGPRSAAPSPRPLTAPGQARGAEKRLVVDRSRPWRHRSRHAWRQRPCGKGPRARRRKAAGGKALRGTGRYRVQLTRDNDVFIPLRERVGLRARPSRRSLRLAACRLRTITGYQRGPSVYTLSEDAPIAKRQRSPKRKTCPT